MEAGTGGAPAAPEPDGLMVPFEPRPQQPLPWEADDADELSAQIRHHLAVSSFDLDALTLTVRHIQARIATMVQALGLTGRVEVFGSLATGFRSADSDLDIAYTGVIASEGQATLLECFAGMLPEYGFIDVVNIFQSSVPLVKFRDMHSGIEIDFCMGNPLGMRNSKLLDTYCRCDRRAAQLGRLVKDWAKCHELIGTADGCLNSYAYMLLVIHYLQSTSPPVLPNLQTLVDGSVPVVDNKWNCHDCWETKFLEDIGALEPSENKESIGELFVNFFVFFVHHFRWSHHAVCIRLNEPGVAVDKFSLSIPTSEEQWYVEDPFDLKHNLAGKCTRLGRARILDEMGQAARSLRDGGCLQEVCFSEKPERYFLKCRVPRGVPLDELVRIFEGFDLAVVHYPEHEIKGNFVQVFFEFTSAVARRRAHTQNEVRLAGCQLHLLASSRYGLAEATVEGTKYRAYNLGEKA